MTIVDCGAPWVTLVDESSSKNHREWSPGMEPSGGGGGGGDTASLKVTTHCQTTPPSPLFQGSLPLRFFYRPLFFGVADHRPLKSNFLNAKLYTKVTPIFPQGISCNEYYVFHKIEWKQTHFTSYYPYLVISLKLTAPLSCLQMS